MPDAHDMLFRTLADPTRRAIFERLCRDQNARVEERLAVDHEHRHNLGSRLWPNLLGEIGIYRVSGPSLADSQIAV